MIIKHFSSAFFFTSIIVWGIACVDLHSECNTYDQCLQTRFFSDSEEIAKYITNNEINEDQLSRGPKGKQNTAILLSGLAQSCAHLGAMTNAQTEQDKKQSILNVVSTVLGVTAQLVMHNEKNNGQDTQTTKYPVRTIDDKLIRTLQDLSASLISISNEEILRNPSNSLPPLLKEFKEAKTAEEQQSYLKKMLLTADTARLYITELLTLLNNFLTTEYENLSAIIKTYILDTISTWYNTTPVAEQTIDNGEKQDLRTPQNILQEKVDYIMYRTLLLGATQIFTKKEILDAQREVLNDTTQNISSVVSMVLATDVLLLEKLLNDEITKALAL